MMSQPIHSDALPSTATIGELLSEGARRFEAAGLSFGHGTANATDEAAWLIAAGLAHDPREPLPLSTVPGVEQRLAIDKLLARRIAERKPAAYLLGEAWFAGERYHVNENTLVPRSPLAELIVQGYAPLLEPGSIQRALDLCTGNGCIGIATALALPESLVDAVDISPAAVTVAESNRLRRKVEGRFTVHCGDLFTPLPAGRQYDVIVSNPPYVDADDMASLSDEFKHEPALGLAAGDDGLDIVLRMLAEAGQWLTEHGVLICEVGNSAEALQNHLANVPFNWLEFEQGGDGIFALYADEIAVFQPEFELAAAERARLLAGE